MSDEKGYVKYLTGYKKLERVRPPEEIGWPEYFLPIGCGGCNYEFGLVYDPARGSRGPPGRENWDDLLEPRKIYLWGGWNREPVDGIVSFTDRSMYKLRHGGVGGQRRGYNEGREYKVYTPSYPLPAVLRCPLCKRREILDPVRLGADRVRMDANYETDAPPVLTVVLPFAGRRGASTAPEWRRLLT